MSILTPLRSYKQLPLPLLPLSFLVKAGSGLEPQHQSCRWVTKPWGEKIIKWTQVVSSPCFMCFWPFAFCTNCVSSICMHLSLEITSEFDSQRQLGIKAFKPVKKRAIFLMWLRNFRWMGVMGRKVVTVTWKAMANLGSKDSVDPFIPWYRKQNQMRKHLREDESTSLCRVAQCVRSNA